jgi:hypothetical protein
VKIKVPKNMTLHYHKKGSSATATRSAGTTVTLQSGYVYYFTWTVGDTVTSSTSADAEIEGYRVYEFSPVYYLTKNNTAYHFQNLFQLGDTQTYGLVIKFLNSPTIGTIRLQKKSSNTAISKANSSYNMAGITYGVYTNKACTSLATNAGLAWDCGCSDKNNIEPKQYSYIVLSYDGKAYMDHYGRNVVFTSAAAKNAYIDEHSVVHIYRFNFAVSGDSATYYVKEQENLASIITKNQDSPYYYYDYVDSTTYGRNRYSNAGQPVSVSGYQFSNKVYTCEVDADT